MISILWEIFILNSISLMDWGLFKLFISYWVSYDSLCLLRNWSSSSKMKFMCIEFTEYSSSYCGLQDQSLLIPVIPDIGNLYILFFFFSFYHTCSRFEILLIFSKESALCFIHFLYWFSAFNIIDFGSYLYYIFHLFAFAFVYLLFHLFVYLIFFLFFVS